MTTATTELAIPVWDVADRMRKTLRERRIPVQAMADYFEVTRTTVGNWLSGRTQPTSAVLRLWALRTGVPFEWLKDGVVAAAGPNGGGTGLETAEDGGPRGARTRNLRISSPKDATIIPFPMAPQPAERAA